MKRFLVIGFLSMASLANADKFNYCTGCIDYTSSGGSGVTVYPASATASFPFGLNASTITGAGLGTCGNSTHAIGVTSTGTFACQLIVGSGGSPSAPIFSVQYNNPLGSFAGSSNFRFYGSSFTLGSSLFNTPGDSIYIGQGAGGANPPGGNSQNICIGDTCSDQITTGTGNIGIGYIAHERLTTGQSNLSIGNGAGTDLISGSRNVCIGGDGNSWQPCQSILNGSSNTMVGAGTGSIGMRTDDSANSFFGYKAGPGASGDASLNGALCLGAYCIVQTSFTAQIGGQLNSGYEVLMHVSSAAVDSSSFGVRGVGYSWPKTVGASGGLFSVDVSSVITFVTAPVLSATQTWTGGNTWTSPSGGNFTYGMTAGSVTASNLSSTQIPFANASKTLIGDNNLVWDTANTALNIGGGGLIDTFAVNITGGAGNEVLALNEVGGYSNVPIGFYFANVNKGIFGMTSSGSQFHWTIAGSGDLLNLNSVGKLVNTYEVNAGSYTGAGLTTCGDATHAIGYNSSSKFFCQTVTGSGGGGASTLGVTTGTSAGWTGPVVQSSPTATINFDQAQFNALLEGASTAYVTLQAGISNVTGNYTLASTSTVVLADASGASLTVTLPTAVGISGRVFRIKRTSSGANTVTIATSASQTIDGATTQILNVQNVSVDVISDNSNWQLE